jgi:hypothetical protein
MMIQTAERALNRAARDYRHAVAMLMQAETPRAQARHSRRAKVAARRMAEARRELEWVSLEWADDDAMQDAA